MRDDAAALGRCRDSPFTKRKSGSFAGVLRPKVRDRYADESDALGRREDGPDQAKGDLVQPVPGFNARFHRSTAGRYLKVSPFDFHRHTMNWREVKTIDRSSR